ncbi:MAG TPA: hypothetical protein VGP99_06160 [Tepidisphaeraceae bacterium]|jgi:hypothetical protein|nr:hypothetical protein [Tepidisphaeraceae bacterium]
MSDGGQEPSNFDRYLDDLMDGAELRAFEEQMSRDPQLRAQVEAQRQIDDSLRRVLVVPAPQAVPSAASSRASVLLRLRRSPWIAIAAVLIIGVSVWRVWDVYYSRPTEEVVYPGAPPRSMDLIYKVEKDRGFVPMWKCETDKEFATTFWKNLGAALTFRNPPANVKSLGLSYGNVVDLSPQTVYMLFKIDGREVIVFIDHKKNDHAPKITTPGLNLFRRETGQFVLYEMTPLNRPMVYDKFEPFEMPREWVQ